MFNLAANVGTFLGMIPLDKSAQTYVKLTVLDRGMIAILLFFKYCQGDRTLQAQEVCFWLVLAGVCS
jgi:hypothetical protein